MTQPAHKGSHSFVPGLGTDLNLAPLSGPGALDFRGQLPALEPVFPASGFSSTVQAEVASWGEEKEEEEKALPLAS